MAHIPATLKSSSLNVASFMMVIIISRSC
uniref:Uncharacterized protein n=1 Tax=Arundo donax TaxID=35708 RepID=A0A0A9B8Y0_ARUDO